MTELTEQRVGYGFGLLGGFLIALGGIVSLAFGVADVAFGRPYGAVGAVSQAVVLFVVGGLAVFFAWLGHRDWSARPLASGILLVVLAILGLVVGVGANLLALVGSLFVVLAGVLYLLEPAKKTATSIVTSA